MQEHVLKSTILKKKYDEGRAHDIEKYGIRILRFTNKEILNNLNEVQTTILNIINDLSPL